MSEKYKAKGTHYDETIKSAAAGGDIVAKSAQSIISNAQGNYKDCYAAGDQAGMDYWHKVAESARAEFGYSGGDDGTEYIPTKSGEAVDDGSNSARKGLGGGSSGSYGGGEVMGASSGYTPYQMPEAESAEAYIRELYAAQEEANLESLKSAYEQNVLALDSTAEKIPEQYTAARNNASSENEVAKAAFNEYASAQGLGSGTGGQARLSLGNALLGSLTSISAAEADALSEVELTRVQLESAYNSNIAQALAQGRYDLAQALLTEFVRLDQAKLSTASAQASENYRAYTANK